MARAQWRPPSSSRPKSWPRRQPGATKFLAAEPSATASASRVRQGPRRLLEKNGRAPRSRSYRRPAARRRARPPYRQRRPKRSSDHRKSAPLSKPSATSSPQPTASASSANRPRRSYASYELLDRLGCRWYLPGDLGECLPTSHNHAHRGDFSSARRRSTERLVRRRRLQTPQPSRRPATRRRSRAGDVPDKEDRQNHPEWVGEFKDSRRRRA